jgi:hypothetical protein
MSCVVYIADVSDRVPRQEGDPSMTRLRRQALSHLLICAVTAVAVAILYLVSRDLRTSLAGFALLGALGLEQWASRRRPAIADERDAATQRSAVLVSYTVFWLCFVAWGVAVSVHFGDRRAVPLEFVEPVVWTGFWLVTGVRAAATLVLDTTGA